MFKSKASKKKVKLDSLYKEGIDLYRSDEYEKGLSKFDKMLKIDSKDPRGYFGKAQIYSLEGKNKEALNMYDEAIKLDPKYVPAHNNKGLALSHLRRYEDAISCYDEAIKLNPKYAVAYRNKANALSHIGQKEDAIRCYDEAIKLDPKDAVAHRSKGVALSHLGQKEDAIRCYDEAIKLDPKSANSAQNILSGKVSLDTSNTKISLATNLISLIPFGGSMFGSGIEAAHNFIKSAKFQKDASNLTKLARNHEHLDKVMGDVGRHIVLHPEKKSYLTQRGVEGLRDDSHSWLSRIVTKCKQFGLNVEEGLFGERYESSAAKLGHKDASMIIDSWVNGKVSVTKDPSNIIYESHQFAEAFCSIVVGVGSSAAADDFI